MRASKGRALCIKNSLSNRSLEGEGSDKEPSHRATRMETRVTFAMLRKGTLVVSVPDSYVKLLTQTV